jgi:hypothetical protein
MIEELLERLDKIDWRSLSHNFGSADDIPELIRRAISEPDIEELISIKGDIWSTALWSLDNALIHQGTISEALSYTIPFLTELLTYKTIQNRKAISEILLEAVLTSYNYDLSYNARTDEQKKYQIYIKKTREALGKGVEIYLKLLTDENEYIRLSAATISSYFALDSNEIASALRKFLIEEKNSRITDYFYGMSKKFIPELKEFYLQWQLNQISNRERREPTW